MLGEQINCRGVVGAVTDIKSLHLWHEVEEEASHPLLALRKPEDKKRSHTDKMLLCKLPHTDKKIEQKHMECVCVPQAKSTTTYDKFPSLLFNPTSL